MTHWRSHPPLRVACSPASHRSASPAHRTAMMHDVDESLPDSSYHSSPKDDGDDDANPFEASTVRMHMDSAAEGAAERAGLAAASSASPPPRRSPHSAARMFTSISSTLASSMPAAFSSMELPSAHDTQAYFTHAAHESRTSQLRKVLGWRELIALGVGCTIGAGIFVVTGVVAATKAGPALFLCYIVSGIACALAGLCYSELASMAPSAGSAYSYARASLGQTIGWIIGWDLFVSPIATRPPHTAVVAAAVCAHSACSLLVCPAEHWSMR